MTLTEYIQGKTEVIKGSILQVKMYLMSNDAFNHRNIRASQERRLKKLQENYNRFSTNQLSKEDVYYYETLYAQKPFDINIISAV